MENLSSSFSVKVARFMAAMFRNSRHKPKGRRWNFDEKVLALSLLNSLKGRNIFFHLRHGKLK
jgi:hypothetical protein